MKARAAAGVERGGRLGARRVRCENEKKRVHEAMVLVLVGMWRGC